MTVNRKTVGGPGLYPYNPQLGQGIWLTPVQVKALADRIIGRSVLVIPHVDHAESDIRASARWVGERPTIFIVGDGLFQNEALHEIAHLLVADEHDEHGPRWSETFARLQSEALDPDRYGCYS